MRLPELCERDRADVLCGQVPGRRVHDLRHRGPQLCQHGRRAEDGPHDDGNTRKLCNAVHA